MRLLLALSLVLVVGTVGCAKKKTPPPPAVTANPTLEVVPEPTPAPAPVVTETPITITPAPAPAGGTVYIVKKGDTLSNISRAHYGNLSGVKKIIAANPGIDPDRIKPGQKLVLP